MPQFESVAELLRTSDLLIKQGKLHAAIQLLGQLEVARVQRSEALSVAKICRRAGLFKKGLRVLQPLVRNEQSLRESATPREIAEYSSILSRNGSVQEALGLLSTLDPAEVPETLLYRGFCHILRWEYQESNVIFEQILGSNLYDSYTHLIARVNLASGLIAVGRFDAAENLLNETLLLAQKMDARRLLGNLLELRGGARVLRGDFTAATIDLQAALDFFGNEGTYDQLLARKWLAVIAATNEKSIEPLWRFRQDAFSRKHWESVREADLFAVKQKFNQQKFDSLLFGSPQPAYRERAIKLVSAQASDSFIWGKDHRQIFDLRSGSWLESSQNLSPGKKIHHLLLVLSRDFYAPTKLGVLFAEIYPAEHFDVNSSPMRIRQLIKRARRWIEENDLQISIRQSPQGYSMNPKDGLGIKLELHRHLESTKDLLWSDLQKLFPPGQVFSIKQACGRLGSSNRSLLRLIEPAVTSGRLLRLGQGRATRYKRVG